jgi:putative acetyltransferase
MIEVIQSYARSMYLKRLYVEASITAKPFFEKRGFQLMEKQTVVLRGVEFINYKMKFSLSDAP